jgi:hypothetical protein
MEDNIAEIVRVDRLATFGAVLQRRWVQLHRSAV